MKTKAERQAFRDRLYPVGLRVEAHEGRHVIVSGEVVDNSGVMLRVKLDDGREVYKYDHDVWVPD